MMWLLSVSYVKDAELAFIVLPLHLDVPDYSVGRSSTTALDDRLHIPSLALHNRLHPAVPQIPHPAPNVAPPSLLLDVTPKEDALHPARNIDACSNSHGCSLTALLTSPFEF
jgi:hypothetical protein